MVLPSPLLPVLRDAAGQKHTILKQSHAARTAQAPTTLYVLPWVPVRRMEAVLCAQGSRTIPPPPVVVQV